MSFLILIYGKLMVLDPILERDDSHVLKYLKSADMIWGYLRNFDLQSLIVYQPLRDLTFFMDLKIGSAIGLGSFHFTNLLIFGACLWVIHRILNLLYGSSRISGTLLLVYAVHPIFVGSVAWISARKHLLSFFFILLATEAVLRKLREGSRGFVSTIKPLFFYGLSLLSQPIHVLWPLWALFVWKTNPVSPHRRQALPAVLLCLPILIVGALFNLSYYSGLYQMHTSAQKILGTSHLDFGVWLVQQGRYIFNLLFPFRLSAIYSPGSVWNILGIAPGVALLWLSARGPQRAEKMSWVVFYILPLLVVSNTNIFVSDTYALVPSFGLLNLLILLFREKMPRNVLPLSAVALVILGFLSLQQAGLWLSDRALWEYAFRVEPCPRTLALHADWTLRAGDPAEAIRLAEALKVLDPAGMEHSQIMAHAIFLDRTIANERKISLIRENVSPSPWRDYFLGALHAQKGDFAKAFDDVQIALRSPNEFLKELPLVTAEAVFFCQKAGKMECEAVGERIRKNSNESNWDPGIFEERLRELRQER